MSLHADALAALSSWLAPSSAQEALRVRYVDHLRARPDGVYRGCRPDHLTASTLVLDEDATHALLTLHAKAQRWFQFGGHCEARDRTLADAATREAREESGLPDLVVDPVPIHLSEHPVPFCGPTGDVHHLDVRYLAIARSGAQHAVSEESLDVRWWPVDALPDPEPEMVELVALARARAQSASPLGGGSTLAAADQPSR